MQGLVYEGAAELKQHFNFQFFGTEAAAPCLFFFKAEIKCLVCTGTVVIYLL